MRGAPRLKDVPDEWPFYSVESDGGEPSSPAATQRAQPHADVAKDGHRSPFSPALRPARRFGTIVARPIDRPLVGSPAVTAVRAQP
jgi:hypothetical protein